MVVELANASLTLLVAAFRCKKIPVGTGSFFMLSTVNLCSRMSFSSFLKSKTWEPTWVSPSNHPIPNRTVPVWYSSSFVAPTAPDFPWIFRFITFNIRFFLVGCRWHLATPVPPQELVLGDVSPGGQQKRHVVPLHLAVGQRGVVAASLRYECVLERLRRVWPTWLLYRAGAFQTLGVKYQQDKTG